MPIRVKVAVCGNQTREFWCDKDSPEGPWRLDRRHGIKDHTHHGAAKVYAMELEAKANR